MRKTFKFRIYPTRSQVRFLEWQLREACDLYNCAIEERRDAWKTCRKTIRLYDQSYQLKDIRAAGLTGLQNYGCCIDVLMRVDVAFKRFFARCQRGSRPGYPRFKSAKRYDSITYASHNHGWGMVGERRLRVQGAGLIRIKMHRPIEGKVKTLTIARSGTKWYACFSCEYTPCPLPTLATEVGIDVGIDCFATLSDGTEIANPRYFRTAERELSKAHRKLDRRKRGSKRRKKASMSFAKKCRKVRNRRDDFQHKTSRTIVNSFGVIIVEDLDIAGLIRNSRLAKDINDAAWASFFRKLSYKAEEAGREFIKVDARGTSQRCLCGCSVRKTLHDRWHYCPSCALSAPRDHVSAELIRRLGTSRQALTCGNSQCVA